MDFPNTPTSGFVLNKKAGGYNSGWNHRQTYVRVYDPRDFEFEISIPNLLYILENTNSIKGKGLDGEFVYGWDGSELVLIPTSSPDYIEISEFNKILHDKTYIKAKQLKIGATYRTKDNSEWVYMGRFDCHEYGSVSKKYFFCNGKNTNYYFETIRSLGDKLIEIVSEDCVENYTDLFDKLEHSTRYSPIDDSRDEYVEYEYNILSKKIGDGSIYCYDRHHQLVEIRNKHKAPNVFQVTVRNKNDYWNRDTVVYEGTLEDIYEVYKPTYKNKYLANGKLYRKGE